MSPSAVSGVQDKRYPNTPNSRVNENKVKYCVWNDDEGNNVLMLAAGLAAKNTLVDVNKFIYGETAHVIPVSGVGLSAAAVFTLEADDTKLVKEEPHIQIL